MDVFIELSFYYFGNFTLKSEALFTPWSVIFLYNLILGVCALLIVTVLSTHLPILLLCSIFLLFPFTWIGCPHSFAHTYSSQIPISVRKWDVNVASQFLQLCKLKLIGTSWNILLSQYRGTRQKSEYKYPSQRLPKFWLSLKPFFIGHCQKLPQTLCFHSQNPTQSNSYWIYFSKCGL